MTLYTDRKNPRISASALHPENLPHGDWTPVADTVQAVTEATAQPPDPAQLADDIEAARDRLVALLNLARIVLRTGNARASTTALSAAMMVEDLTDSVRLRNVMARLREMGE